MNGSARTLSFAERWIAPNLCGLVLLVVGAGCLGSLVVFDDQFVETAVLATAVVTIGCAVTVLSGRSQRLRVYSLLVRRIERRGFALSDVVKHSGQPCLAAQSIIILWRYRKLRHWLSVAAAPLSGASVFVAHDNPEFEEAINFNDPIPQELFDAVQPQSAGER